MYSEQEETRVIRTPKWALFKRRFNGPSNQGIGDELYDVENDPHETVNLSGLPEHTDTEARLAAILADFFETYVCAEADL